MWHVLRGAELHRVTRAGSGPWWFSSSGGRFDLEPPRGTCYLADDALVALLESLGPVLRGPVVDVRLLVDLQLWRVELPRQCDAADATARPARSFGVTAELAVMTPYDLPRRWARAFAAAGYEGVRYRSRHDPAGGRCLALFGAAGERQRWRRGRAVRVLESELPVRLAVEAGIVVEAENPSAATLDDVRD